MMVNWSLWIFCIGFTPDMKNYTQFLVIHTYCFGQSTYNKNLCLWTVAPKNPEVVEQTFTAGSV